MKHIVKHTEPREFAEWKTTYPAAKYTDLGCDRLFPGAQRARWALRTSLAAEQGHLCCYCESRIDSGDFHIEHFKPKAEGLFPELQLSYDNLHACCHKMPIGGTDECCGHKKSDTFIPELISPLDPDCENHFQYSLTGEISSTDTSGQKTILIMKLNSSLLVRRRKLLIEDFEDMTDDEYQTEIEIHLDPSASPLGEYFTTIKYLHDHSLLH